MAFKYYPLAWKTRVNTSNERSVLLCLADYADNDTGKCFPQRQTIADKTLISKRSVDAALKGLRKAGYINWRQRSNQNGRTSNEFELKLESADNALTEETNEPKKEVSANSTVVSADIAEVSANSVPVRAPVAQEPITDPIFEPVTEPVTLSSDPLRGPDHIDKLQDALPAKECLRTTVTPAFACLREIYFGKAADLPSIESDASFDYFVSLYAQRKINLDGILSSAIRLRSTKRRQQRPFWKWLQHQGQNAMAA